MGTTPNKAWTLNFAAVLASGRTEFLISAHREAFEQAKERQRAIPKSGDGLKSDATL